MRAFIALFFALSWSVFASSSARAYEDKITLGAGPGYALLPSSASSPHGVAIDAHVGIGVSEVIELREGVTYALHPGSQALHSALLRSEMVYVIDIVDVVPHAGVGVAALIAVQDGATHGELAAQGALGAAYWLSFDALLDLELRALLRPAHIDDDPLYLLATLSFVLAFDQ